MFSANFRKIKEALKNNKKKDDNIHKSEAQQTIYTIESLLLRGRTHKKNQHDSVKNLNKIQDCFHGYMH